MDLLATQSFAVGDAENDLSLFGWLRSELRWPTPSRPCENTPTSSSKKRTGLESRSRSPAPCQWGARWCPPRWWIEIGTVDDGTPVKIPGSQARILVTGPAGAGKSYLVGLMAEQWIQAEYSVLLLDPEGDHLELQELNQVQVVAGRHQLPEPAELMHTLHPYTSIVLDLSGLAPTQDRLPASTVVGGGRAPRSTRIPHWVIYDEAHLLGNHEEAHWTRRGGYVLSSFAPAALPANEIDDTDVVLEIDNPDTAGDVASRTLRRAVCGSAPGASFVHHRRAPHGPRAPPPQICRHPLPRERRFYFRPSTAKPSPRQAPWAISAPR